MHTLRRTIWQRQHPWSVWTETGTARVPTRGSEVVKKPYNSTGAGDRNRTYDPIITNANWPVLTGFAGVWIGSERHPAVIAGCVHRTKAGTAPHTAASGRTLAGSATKPASTP